jgi:flagellar M-ring protein FliF
MDSVAHFFGQLGKLFNALTPAKRASIIAVAVIVLVSISVFVVSVNTKEYAVLFTNLSTQDAGRLVGTLQEKKIPYKLAGAGNAVSVPAEPVSDPRLELAVSGLPTGGGRGF